jgi:hypothetical protein
LVVVGLVALVVIQKRRGVGKRGQNANRDPSQALQIDADGDVLQESVKSLTSPSEEHEFDFENPIFENPIFDIREEMAVEVERPKTPSFENGTSNGNGSSNGHGHARII